MPLGSSPLLGLSPAKNTRVKSHKKASHRPAVNDAVSGASCRARREVGRGQHQPDQAPEHAKAKSRKRTSHRLAFSHAVSGGSRWVRREVGRAAPTRPSPRRCVSNSYGAMPLVSFVHSTFGTRPTFYIPPATLIRRPHDMLSSSLRQHILDYEPPRGFFIPVFTMFDGFVDPYDRMLHYSQAMTLNAGNDQLLCRVFMVSL